MNIAEVDNKLNAFKTKSIIWVLAFTLGIILTDYVFATILYFDIYNGGHGLGVGIGGSFIMITIMLMTDRFKALLKELE